MVPRHLLAVITGLVTATAVPAQTPQPDRLAEIGAFQTEPTAQLITPLPPKLPNKVLRHRAHDPNAIFKPAEKLDTPDELAEALQTMRAKMAPFLETHSPQLPPTWRIQGLETFDWRVATAEDWQNFSAILAGEGRWKQVTIPHYGEPLGRTNTFYRTTFTLEPWHTNETVFIRFRGVDYKAHVFVNGSLVGSHEGFFAPFEFDITRTVIPGTNAVLVQVDNDFPTLGVVNAVGYPDLTGDKLYAATGPGYDEPTNGWHHCPPGMGIWQPVSVEIRPRVHVEDVFVRPLPESGEAEALVEVWNCDAHLRSVELEFSVYGLNFPAQIIESRQIENPEQACMGMSFHRVRFAMPDVRWWSLNEPWLYDFHVTVRCPELGTVDSARQSFGMRKFELDTTSVPRGRFYLNGREIRLRGANTMGAEQQAVMRGLTNQLRDVMLLAKIAHLNFLRFTQRPVQSEIYDMADRLGLMVQTDFPLFGHMRPNQFAEAVRQVAEMERLIRSHPSCVLVSYINERFSAQKSRGKISWRMNRDGFDQFFQAADAAVHFANPDRVIKAVDGDYDPPAPGLPDNHCYTLWYFRNGIDIGLLHKGFWQPVKSDWNYACGEFGAEGLDRAELMRARCPPEWLPIKADEERAWTPERIPRAQTAAMQQHFFDRPDSFDAWIRASRVHQAWATRLMTEAFRRDNRMVSFAIHQFIDAWPTGWMKAIVDVERQPKPAYFAYREALTPVMANIRTDRWKFFSGETVRCEFWVCNDTEAVLANARLAWQLELDGQVVHAQQARAVTEPMKATFQGFTAIPAPKVEHRTSGVLRLALFYGQRLVHDTAVDLEFFPRSRRTTTPVQIVGDSEGAAAQLVRLLGLKVQPRAGVILVNDLVAFTARGAELELAMKNGARVVLFDLPPGEHLLPGSNEPVVVKGANPHFLSRQTGHSLVSGFEPFDFRFWFEPQADMIAPLARAKFSGDGFEPILLCQDALAVGERSVGKGKLIVCLLDLAGRVGTNPTAYLFAQRMISD